MRISIDERDIYDYLDMELYIKEREYLLYDSEYQLLLMKAQNLKIIEEFYVKGAHEGIYRDDIDGKMTIAFQDKNHPKAKFYCWSNVKKNYGEYPRKRQMQLNHEDIHNVLDANQYLEERNRLINDREYTELIQSISIPNQKFTCDVIPSIVNQSVGVWHGNIDHYDLWAYQMYYKPNVLERRRD